ncbi:MAG TPA: diguanylate cyclase [Planctomycetota bacterium]|nr:diguanylate cyclase [Planctomycetota bacterium]
MAHLVFIDGKYMGTTLPLASVNTIGRTGDCDFQFLEPDVLDRHAIIRYKDGQYRILRMDPGAALSVNNNDITEEVLRHGDMIALGSLTVLFSDETPSLPTDYLPREEAMGDTMDAVIETRVKQLSDPAEAVAAIRRDDRVSGDLETLYRVASTINASLNLDEILRSLNDILFQVFKPDRVFILLADEQGALRVASQRISERSALTGFVKVSGTILREVVQKREGILTLDAAADERFKRGDSIVDQSIQSALCVPVAKREKVLGAMYVDSLTITHPFNREDLGLLNAIAPLVALAIENVLNYERSVEYSRKLIHLGETTRRISSFLSREAIYREAVESACRIFASDKATLLIADGRGELGVVYSSHIPRVEWARIRLHAGERWAGQAYHYCKPFLKTDAPTKDFPPVRTYASKSFLIVPVVARSEGIRTTPRPIGVLCVTDKKTRDAYHAHDQEFMTIFAAQVGITLQNARLFERSTVDTLTGLYTRQFFFARLEEHIAACRSQSSPLCALMLDLDHFKEKNDQFGHAAGDIVLAMTAAVAKDRIDAAEGMVARFGGEEFIAVLPSIPLIRAREIAEEIRKGTEKRKIAVEGKEIPTTVSIGVAELRETDTPETVVKRADAALYAAKRGGRNKVMTDEDLEV